MEKLVLLITISLSVVIVCTAMMQQDPPEDYVPTEEKCWEHPRECALFSGSGWGMDHPYCWKRCVCRGFRQGRCVVDKECKTENQLSPWKCQCIPSSQHNQHHEQMLRMRICGRW